ncbi:Ubinuclein-2 [Channa argus]|uniref:Ubinuclein-2 n=1 Tax=Channa argus TaxID=215402 RepID=A0A6G1PD44_CHAAH|nr:Ubinuclein-2 [Channa argus]
MAEPRRVQLTPLSSDLHPSTEKQSTVQKLSPGVFQVNDHCSDAPAESDTVRLVLALFEPDDRSFPEFSYNELIDNKINHTRDQAPPSRFDEEKKRENDELAAIARKLEGRHGGKPKKKDRIQDLIDIGYGYDDEDSFIDNSEAYDEFVPASITTKFGGFYVNSGVLQFRQASEAETETEDFTTEKTHKRSKKRKFNDEKKKRCRVNEEMKNDVDSKLTTASEVGPKDELKKKKKKRTLGTLSVTSMLKKFQREKEKERQKMEKASQKAAVLLPTIPLCPADAAGGGGSGLSDPLLNLIGSTNDHALIQAASTVDFDIDLDSLLDASDEALLPKPHLQSSTDALFLPTNDQNPLKLSAKAPTQNAKNNLQISMTHPEQNNLLSEATSTQQCVLVPEGLSPGLEGSVRKLMAAAKTLEGESKLKFFTLEINSILLDIELQCREQGGQVRSKVYTHLSSFLPCSRDTLLKRVKKLLLAHIEEPPNLEDSMQKLKEAIGRAMPEQIACYHENCQAYEQVKASRAMEEGKESNAVTGDNVEEKVGRRGGPKKLFKWNEEIRECLCNVLRPKMERCTKERKGVQEMEDYLKTVLDNEVKPLWPKGWMQSRVLIRETRKLLGIFTSLSVKTRSDKKQSSISGVSTVSDVVQGTPPLKSETSEDKDVFIVGSDISKSFGSASKEGAALKREEFKKGGDPVSFASAELPKPPVIATSAPPHSLLDLLADQALAQQQPFSVSQELLAAAVAKYKRSVQHWRFGLDTKSPPFPPPPPHSSPVAFPVRGACQMVLAQLPQGGEFARNMDAGYVQTISDDDDDIAIQ